MKIGYKIKDARFRIRKIMHHASCIMYLFPVYFFLLFTVHCSLFTVSCFAEEPQTFITSDSLKHEKSTSMYTAKGSVLVEQGETIMIANEMQYDEKNIKCLS